MNRNSLQKERKYVRVKHKNKAYGKNGCSLSLGSVFLTEVVELFKSFLFSVVQMNCFCCCLFVFKLNLVFLGLIERKEPASGWALWVNEH